MNSHTITYPDFYNTENIMLDRISVLMLIPSKTKKGYQNQIEEKLRYLTETCQSDVTKKEHRYEIVQEYSDIVMAKLSDDGDIIVNKGFK